MCIASLQTGYLLVEITHFILQRLKIVAMQLLGGPFADITVDSKGNFKIGQEVL